MSQLAYARVDFSHSNKSSYPKWDCADCIASHHLSILNSLHPMFMGVDNLRLAAYRSSIKIDRELRLFVIPFLDVKYADAGNESQREEKSGRTMLLRKSFKPNWRTSSRNKKSVRKRFSDEISDFETEKAAIGELIADITHEVRTPMNGMFGMLECLLASELTADQREAAMTAQAAAEDLLTFFNNIIDLPIVEADAISIRRASFDLDSTLESLLDSIGARTRIKGADIEIRYTPADRPLAIIGDIDRLRQVFSNLITYVVRQPLQGKVVVEASRMPMDGNRCLLRLRIEADSAVLAQKLFPGAATDAATAPRRLDAGELGLVVCRRLIDMMGGKMEIAHHGENKIQIHTFLPFDLAPAALAGSHEQSLLPCMEKATVLLNDGQKLPENPTAFDFAGKQILVVDDDAVNRQVAVRLLKELGCSVDTACDGKQALSMHAENTYDLVLMDCEMPVMDGIEATAKIRSKESAGSRTPVIAWTARFMPGGAGNLLAGGFDDFMPKPMRRDALREMMSAWMPVQAIRDEVTEPDIEDEIAEIREIFGNGFAELAALFHSDSTKRIDALKSAASIEDTIQIAKVAHAFSGSAASIGAMGLSALCKELELQSRAGSLQKVNEQMRAIEKEFASVTERIQNMLAVESA